MNDNGHGQRFRSKRCLFIAVGVLLAFLFISRIDSGQQHLREAVSTHFPWKFGAGRPEDVDITKAGSGKSPAIKPPTDSNNSKPKVGLNMSPDDYEAAIVYLVGVRSVEQLMKSIVMVHTNIPHIKPWPIILFHTGDYETESSRNELLMKLRHVMGGKGEALVKRIRWELLHWTLPKGISSDINVVQPIGATRWPGYHHMCHFFFTDIMHHPALSSFKYYLRLDTDSFIRAPICQDPFQVMHRRSLSYMYRVAGGDTADVTVGMWPYISDYASRHPEIEARLLKNRWAWPPEREKGNLNKWRWGFPAYYNNFEVVDLERFRQADFTAFEKNVDSVPERIFKFRWGDAPLRYAEVYMFLDVETDIYEMCEMDYEHSFVMPPSCNCTVI